MPEQVPPIKHAKDNWNLVVLCANRPLAIPVGNRYTYYDDEVSTINLK